MTDWKCLLAPILPAIVRYAGDPHPTLIRRPEEWDWSRSPELLLAHVQMSTSAPETTK